MKVKGSGNEKGNVERLPEITRERVTEEVKILRTEIAYGLKHYETMFPNPTERTLSRVMTE